MSSPTSNSKPLHNFSLEGLKWPKNHATSPLRGRRELDPASPQQTSSCSSVSHLPSPMPSLLQSPPVAKSTNPNHSPMMPPHSYSLPDPAQTQTTSSSVHLSEKPKPSLAESPKKVISPSVHFSENLKPNLAESPKKVISPSAICSASKTPEKDISVAADMNEPKSTKIRLRVTKQALEEGKELENGKSQSDLIQKRWNLRPRKPLNHKSSANCSSKPDGGPSKPETDFKPPKLKFSVTLTKKEIAEDILAMTGAKPSKTPKRRTKNVQKQLDNLIPAKKLASINTDEYKAVEALLKLHVND